jgi:glycosyltransferase involved in cell wall biosynthesis
MTEIWVAGCPSAVGGADTELLHQIILFKKKGITVHLVPNSIDNIAIELAKKLECQIHEYKPDVFKDKHVICYCNGPALERLPEMSKPASFTWFNCMTWTFPKEIEALQKGLITHTGYVSKYQESILLKEYADVGVKPPINIGYFPYLDINQFKILQKNFNYYGLGRISRADPAKYSEDCWKIFDRILSPIPKKIFMLGYDDKIEKKIGKPPAGLDFLVWHPGAVKTEHVFSRIDVMVHKTGGSRESYCRVLIEAMAYGKMAFVEHDYAFPEILVNSKELGNWIMCKSSEEMSYKASELVFYQQKLRQLQSLCRKYVERYLCDEQRSINSWKHVK